MKNETCHFSNSMKITLGKSINVKQKNKCKWQFCQEVVLFIVPSFILLFKLSVMKDQMVSIQRSSESSKN